MPITLALLSRHFALSSIVAGIGALVLVPVAYCLTITFPPPKQRSERALDARALRFLRDPFFLFAALAMAMQSGMEGMSNDWTTRYYKIVTLADQNRGEWQPQLALVALTSGMALSRLALSALLKRVSSRLVLLGSVAVAALGATVLMQATDYAVSLAGTFLIGVGLAAGFPVVLGYLADRHPQQSGTAFSMIFVVALVGNMSINKSFGYIAQRHGVQQYPTMLLVLLSGSAVLLFLAIKQLNRHTSK
jgi:MFS family permease